MRRELNVVFSYIRDAMFLSGAPTASRAWAVLGPVIGPATLAATGLGRLQYTLSLIWVLTMLGLVNPFLYFRAGHLRPPEIVVASLDVESASTAGVYAV